MRTETLDARENGRRFLVVLDSGEEVVGTLTEFGREHAIQAASLAAIGALREGTLAWWDAEAREYVDHPVAEQVEVASLLGNLSLAPDGDVKVHAHCVLGLPDSSARAGHLRAGVVHPTLECFVEEGGMPLRRERDPRTGLALLRP